MLTEYVRGALKRQISYMYSKGQNMLPAILLDPSVEETIRKAIRQTSAGAFLALDHPVQADVVIGVPDSGIEAAIGFSRQSGIPYGIGFIKNKYIGRTFIQPGQKQRIRWQSF